MSADTSFTAAAAGARRVSGVPFPLSRRTDPVSLRPGSRVIVRYRVDAPTPAATDGHEAHISSHPTVTDVIGTLISVDPLVVRPSTTARESTIPHDRVVVAKVLSAQPVRNSDIRAVEQATAEAFPGLEHRMIGGWLARAGDGITERSNSATPIGPSAATTPVPLAELREFYDFHGLPTQLLVPDRIGRTARAVPGTRGPEIIVMTRDLHDLSDLPDLSEPGGASGLKGHGIRVDITAQPTEEWLNMYHFRGKPLPEHALRMLMTQIDGTLGFAHLYHDGDLAAITRATITTGGSRRWLGFSAVEVASDHRRQGLGTLMCHVILAWGADHGADAAYLQVVEQNTAGRALYHGLGFSEHHRHRSLTVALPPAATL